MDHAKLSPSSSYRWIKCAGSIALCAPLPYTTNAAAEEGTGVHALCEVTLKARKREISEDWIGKELRFLYGREWKTMIVTFKHVTNGNIFVRHIVEHFDKFPKQTTVAIEKRIDLTHVHPKMFGTADVILDQRDRLVVPDYKNGFVPVHLVRHPELLPDFDAAGINEQPLTYGCGEAEDAGWIHDEIVLEIIQPNSIEVAPIQSVTVPRKWLRHWQEDVLKPAAKATEDPNAPLVPGPWCKWCPANLNHICPAADAAVQEQTVADFAQFAYDAPALPVPFTMDKAHLLRVLSWAPVIEDWLKAVHGQAFIMAQRGTLTEEDGYKLVPGRGSRRWPTQDSEELTRLLVEAGVPAERINAIWEPRAVRSPAQLEELGKDFRKAVAVVALKEKGGSTLAPTTDRRKQVPSALDEFAQFAVLTE